MSTWGENYQENGMFQDVFKLKLHLQSILPSEKINTEWNTFLALNHLINSITQRFQHKGYEMYPNLQDVIIKACNGESFVKELSIICDFYKSDLSNPDQEVQL